jgi:hypothetical protein
MRFKSVKHAEYEILKAIMATRVEGTFHETIEGIKMIGKMIGVPSNDKVAEQRFNKAASNIVKVISNMAEKRSKYLPEEHPEYGMDIREVRKIMRDE